MIQGSPAKSKILTYNNSKLCEILDNLKCAYSLGQFDLARGQATELVPLIKIDSDPFIRAEFYCYHSLCSLAASRTASEGIGAAPLSGVGANQKKLQTLSKHLYHLVEAESHRVSGDKLAAIDQYDLAIAVAVDMAQKQHEALANELAGRFYLGWNKQKFAALHLREAYSCYQICGNGGAATALEKKFPDLLQSKVCEASTSCPQLAESEGHYRQLVEGSADVTWSLDHNRVFNYISPQFRDIFGLNPEEWIGRQPFELVHPDNVAEIQPATSKNRDSDGVVSFEFRHLCKDGTYKWVLAKDTVINDAQGNRIGQQGVLRDITERKVAQLELEKTQTQFRRMAENSPGMLFRYVFHPDGKTGITYIGPQARAIFKMEPEELILDSNAWLSRVHPDDILELRKAVKESKTLLCPLVSICRLGFSGENLRWIKIMGHPEKLDNGDVVFDGVVVDISDLKRLQEKAERQLQILETTSDFIGTCDGDTKVVYANRALKNLHHHKADGAAPNITDFYPPWAAKILKEQGIPTAIKHGTWSGETALVDHYGKEIPVSQVITVHKTPNGTVKNISTICRDITRQKNAENSLEQARARLLQVTENVPGMIYEYLYQPDGETYKTTYLNENTKAMYGYNVDEVLNNNDALKSRVHPDDLHHLQQKISASVKSLKPFTAVFRATLPEQETRWHQTTGNPELLKDGCVHMSGITLDITEHKAAEQALQKAQAQFHTVSENAPGMIFRYVRESDASHFLDYVGSQVNTLYGVTVDEALNDVERIFQYVHPTDAENFRYLVKQSTEQMKPVNIEFRVSHPQLGKRRHQMLSQPTRSESGGTFWDGIILDITEQKNTERALAEAHGRFQRITENMPGMIYRYVESSNGTRKINYVSSQCQELFEVAPEDVLNDVNQLFKCVHPDDIAMIKAATARSASDLSRLVVEYRLQLPLKGLCWRQAIAQVARNAEGDLEWDGVVIDITRRKNSELSLQSANQQLANATKMKDAFLANMSHELRTPLSAILSMSEGMEQGLFGPVTLAQTEGFEVIKTSSSHLLDMINEILDLAKIESGSIDLELSNIDIKTLCTTCLQLVTQEARQKNIQLSLNLPGKLPPLEADEKRVRQILANLVSNAVKFTPDGGQVVIAVEVIEQASRTLLRISVTDTGIGIEQSKLKNLFDPFVQVDASLNRNYSGTGLGLAMVKQFTELLSGTVSVKSISGSGSTFTVDLPLIQNNKSVSGTAALKSDVQKLAIQKPAIIASRSKLPAFILLAEDDDTVAKVTKKYLEKLKYRVIRTEDGESTLQAAKEHAPDIILMDVQMPGIDGLEAIHRLRKIDAIKDTPIIALTGLAMESDHKRCLDAGADHYLSKPYKMQHLIDLMDELLIKKDALV